MKCSDIQEDFKIIGIVSVLTVLLALIVIDGSFSVKKRFNGTIVKKCYSIPKSDSYHKKTSLSQWYSSPEKYRLTVWLYDTRELIKIEVDSSTFESKCTYDRIEFEISKGYFSRCTWNTAIIK